MHHRYIDIHTMVYGVEMMLYTAVAHLKGSNSLSFEDNNASHHFSLEIAPAFGLMPVNFITKFPERVKKGVIMIGQELFYGERMRFQSGDGSGE